MVLTPLERPPGPDDALITALAILGLVAPAAADPVNLVPYSSIGPNVADFEDLVGVPPPPLIAIFDGILESGDVRFAERFVGQTLSITPPTGEPLAGPLDELSGVPSDPLRLQPGDPNKNLAVLRRGDPLNNNLLPCGNLTCRLFAGLGEGAFALIFPAPVSAFGFIARGGDPGGNPDGDIVVQFFRADGTLIAVIGVLAEDSPAVSSFGFQREGGIKDIAGVSIHTSDPAGLEYDDFRYGDLDFGIFCTPTLLDSSSSATCTIETQNGLDDPVQLSCESLPDGAACNFSPAEVILPDPGSMDVQLSMAVDDRVPESFEFQAVGTSGTARGTFDMSFEETKEVPPVPQAPPKVTDITFTAEDVSMGCQFRSAGSITFDIDVTRVVAETADLNGDGTLKNASELVAADVLSPMATLKLMVFDVDQQPPSGSVPEVDRVFFNGEEIGNLDGENDLWQLNEFEVPIEKVRFPERAPLGSSPTGARNEIRIEIDSDNVEDTWCTAVDWSALSFNAMSLIILIHGNNSNGGFFQRRGFTGELERMKLLFDNSINMPPASIQVNGERLDGFIPNIAKSFGVDSVHLVAHSKGGLDAREYLAVYQPARANDLTILSYTTLSTPHNGSAGADLLILRDRALEQTAELDFDGFPLFTERVLSEFPKADDGELDLPTWLTAVFNARTLSSLVSGQTIINTVAADADGSSNKEIDNNPDEYLEIRQESAVVANLFAQSPFRARIGVNTAYQVLRRVASVAIDFDERREFGVGKRRTVAVLTANPNPQELGNDILVTIPSGQGQGPLADHTRNTEVFRGKTRARNHANVANAGVAQVVGPWIIAAEKEIGDLK